MAGRARSRRSQVVVQPGGSADELSAIWDDIVAASAADSSAAAGDRARARWSTRWQEAEFRVVAYLDGEPVGVLAMDLDDTGPWVERGRRHGLTAVVLLLHVRIAARRRGVGTALLGEALRHAERSGAEHVAVDVPPAAGRTNRFYARLGFGPVTVRRVAGIGALRRRLTGDVALPRRRLLGRRGAVPDAADPLL